MKTKFINKFSEEIYTETYKFEGNGHVPADADINESFNRIATSVASIEKAQGKWTKQFLSVLHNFNFVAGGRITSNAGTGLKGTTLVNCFVSGPTGENQDSMYEILNELTRQGMILKSEGGYGFNADFMRPRGCFINGIGVESPGAVKMLEMWDKQSEVITEGSGIKKKVKKGKNKIRKGAMMVTMSCWHPAIEEFITAKQTPGRLSKFNMSVLISDEFMNAVKNNLSWNLEFPDTTHSDYDKVWDGNIGKWKSLNLPLILYKTFENANELWDLVMKSTYNRNEPGVLFVDTINKMNNLSYCEYISATNPCGEQLLPKHGNCLLGSINLTQYINDTLTDYDYKKLEKDIPTIVKFMDNINDITNYPLPEEKEQARLKRRIGIGYLGYASSLYLIQVRYGSKKALEMTEKLCSFVTNKCYQASAMLAKEKGAFPLYDEKEFLKSNFVQQALTKETIELIKTHGLRNSHLTSIQPTGNSSVFANNVSSGLEPIFMSEYIRTVIQSAPPEGMTLPKIDFANRKYDGSNLTWEWVQEGDEYLLATNFNNTVFKIDQNRGLVKEEKVKDYSLYILEEKGIIAKDQDWVVNTSNLNIDEHIDTMKVFAKYIDSAISKTVNLPNDYSFEDFKSLYVKVYDTGYIKGCTTYRAGTMTSVLSAESSMLNKVEEAGGYIKRPKKLDCDINQIKVLGEKWIVLVGLYEGRPYEVFSIKSGKISIPATLSSGKLIKNGSGKYDLECGDGWLLQDIRNLFESDEQDALTRIISTALRNGVKIEYIVEQLYKSEGSVVSFSKAVARTLKKYVSEKINLSCPNCTSKNIVLEEGCFKCKDCGNSKCQ
jgi:ribonucleoside-diphosphate reductase alpha chain